MAQEGIGLGAIEELAEGGLEEALGAGEIIALE